MLGETGTSSAYRWWRFVAFIVVGVVTGLFSSWYIYENLWSWPVPLLVVVFVVGALVDRRRTEVR